MIYRVSINSADSRVLPVLVPVQYFLAAKLCLFMRSCYQPLFQKHVHSVANILPDRQAKVCLYGELVRAIAHGHKRTSKRMPINLCELLRTFVLAYVIARLIVRLNVTEWRAALGVGLWLWVGFPVVLLTGSML